MTTYEDLQNRAARRFLQTALIVDDRISANEPPAADEQPPEVIESPGLRLRGQPASHRVEDAKSASADQTEEPPPEPNEAPSEEEARAAREEEAVAASVVHVKSMADHFADMDLTCGVLKPAPGEKPEDVTERIARAARGVDILVLDWMLDDESKFTAEEAVKRVVAQDSYGRRLLTIYTTQRELGDISKRLEGAIEQAERVEGDELALDAGGTRIVIFHKGGPTLSEDYEDYERPEAQLPEDLVHIFVELSAGLVPAIVLNALAATRENAHRLLARLGSELDLGYLGHLLRLTYRDDGEQHLLDAVSGELRAVIEDDDGTRAAASQGFDAWLAHHELQLRAAVDVLCSIGAVVGDNDEWHKWRKAHKDGGLDKLPDEDITELLVPEQDAAQARLSDARFAQLLAMRRPYARPWPGLHLGTIAREQEHADRYWLCIQPICDSVRLMDDPPTKFLMLPLEAVEHAKKKVRVKFVVDLPEGGVLHLWPWSDSSDLEMMRLRPNHNEAVHFKPAPDDADGPKRVTTEDGVVLVWVAQLKPAHAARVAHEYGMKLSRVGLDESEWMRMRGSRNNPPNRNAYPHDDER